MLEFITVNIWLLPVFPLLAFLIIGFFYSKLTEKAIGWISISALLLSFAFIAVLFKGISHSGDSGFSERIALYSWISTAEIQIEISFLIDHLTIVMLLLVTVLGCIIQIYAMGCLSRKSVFPWYFTFSNLLFFSLFILILADNFLLLLAGWLGSSIGSYFLLSGKYKEEAELKIAQSAFIFNRVADCCFVLAVLFIFTFFGTFDYDQIFRKSIRMISEPGFATRLGLLLTFAVACKAAMVPFHIWTSGTSVAPIPVAVLILGLCLPVATVYWVARCHVLFLQAPLAMSILSIVGLFTAFLTATMAAVCNDIKRVVGYVAISQIGFMFLALGVGAFDSAIFHLITQAVLIPLLYVGIGNLEYSTKGIEDATHQGKKVPMSYRIFLFGALALSGTPLLSGFFSRNEILWRTLVSQPLGGFGFWVIGLLISGFTVFYIFRIFFLQFHKKSTEEGKPEADIKLLSPFMSLSSYLLVFFTLVVSLLGLPHHSKLKVFLDPTFSTYVKTDLFDLEPQMLPLEISFTAIVILISLMGFGIAYMFYFIRPEMPVRISNSMKPVYNFFRNKWYVEELYQNMLIKPIQSFAYIAVQVVDIKILDKIPVKILDFLESCSLQLNKFQTGLVRSYLLSFVIAIVAIFTYLLLSTIR